MSTDASAAATAGDKRDDLDRYRKLSNALESTQSEIE
jgi:hypothetical protein